MRLAILLFAIVAFTYAQVQFNNTFDCSAGCYITDPTIYVGGLLPGASDDVVFDVTQSNAHFWLVNTTFNVTSFEMSNTGFSIQNAVLKVSELNLSQVFTHIQQDATLIVMSTAELSGSRFYAEGEVYVYEFSNEQTYITAKNNSIFEAHKFEFEGGSIEFDAGSNLTIVDEAEFSSCQITFNIPPSFGEEVDFESVTANFPAGFYVEEQYSISYSNFTAYLPPSLANVTLVLSGKNNLSLSNLVIGSDKIKFNSTTSPFITFTVSDNATFDGNLSVPGQVVVNSGSSVLFNGTVSLSGGVVANVNSYTRIRAIGTLTTGSPIELHGYGTNQAEQNTFTVDNAVLVTPSLNIDRFELRSIAGTTIIQGNVMNNGSIHVFESSNVVVQGNYTQTGDSEFGAYNLANTPGRSVNLFVNGTAQLDGNIYYNASETKDKFTATVLKASDGIVGNFSNSVFTGDAAWAHEISISSNEVSVTITPSDKSDWLHDHPWIWAVVAGGVVVFFAIIFVIARSVRKRNQYTPVGGY